MNTDHIVEQIDQEIGRLQQARQVLTSLGDITAMRSSGGPKGTSGTKPTKLATKRRKMSEEVRARIAAAQRKRWAKVSQTSAPVKAPMKSPGKHAIAKKATPAKKAPSKAKAKKEPVKRTPLTAIPSSGS